ncbi:hypothetical protein W97_07233 [Coniosporium apollinis CBS 100218]|uniref:K Homology domain-containing protein n=1 Tax=Coniosporium apollinis (strain CBS 100218) TaxID=1168221 RepID=R7Z1P0_CONA1|nr:uncharacterized protein W97_07233 [Coniosporium apollinis CBS 100218]EON68085.1 hypothetical protein W97_07233 [Coniosporium apollinis CBS 100218]
MDSEASATTSAQAEGELRPGQLLAKQHAEEEARRQATVEDVVDEEDIAHPPPSATPRSGELSEKAAGKKPAQELNTQSEEAFPALGAPKARAAAVPSAWGGKSSNGVNGGANGRPASSNVSSRASTPASGMMTPASTAASHTVSLPGRHTESIDFAPSQLQPRIQLKKPVQDVLRDINRGSKARVQMKQGAGGRIIFEGQGPVEAVRQSLKEVAKELGAKQSIKVTIPASLRGHIVGRGGSTIQGIIKRTGAKVQMPRQDDPSAPADDDESATIDVLIEGDALSAEMARREVEAIVNERTSTVNMRLKEIPAELYPFLAGAHNSDIKKYEPEGVNIQIPHYHTWTEQAPNVVARGQPLAFPPQANLPILISGERQAAQKAREEIEANAEKLKRGYVINEVPNIERGRHQFVVGERGGSLHDFLEETGCSVILPPSGDDSETIYVIGPEGSIEGAIAKIDDITSQMSMANVDVARQHGNSHAHARDLSRYLRQRQAIEELEKMHDASIVLPSSADSTSSWNIYARENKNAMQARKDVMGVISGFPPSRFASVDVDPFYHQRLQQQRAEQIRREHGVHVVFPETHEDSPQLLLVFEQPGSPSEFELPRKQPSAAEVKEYQAALEEVQKAILAAINGQDQIASRDIEAPPKFHDKIRRYADREQQAIPDDAFPVELLFGGSRAQRGQQPSGNGISVRGPSSSVDDMAEKLLAFILQEEQDERERGYTMSFEYPQKFANFLIGKRGENIRKLREEFDVEIQVHDGKVDLKGPQAKCEAAKKEILTMAKRLEDEATYVLKIKPQYHRDLIGARGSQVNRLQDRYNVRVNFPRSGQNEDAEAESGGSQKNFRAQAADEVIIKGPKRGADEAREELLNLLQYTIDNSHSATVSVAPDQIPSLIGQGGREMENLRLTTGAQVDVPSRDQVDASGRAEIKIRGTKKAVEDAKKMLEERAKVFDNTVTRTIEIDKKHHKALIGGGGSNIRQIVVSAGGPDDRRELARMVRFPRPESAENTIRVEGPTAVVDKIVAALQDSVNQRENSTTTTMDVAPSKHRLLIGRGGEIRRSLESQFNVTIDVPKQSATGAARTAVKVTGQPPDVEKAVEHISQLVKDQEGEMVSVPRKYHHLVADNGAFFRRLRNDFRVTVDHNGQTPPARPEAPQQQGPRGRVAQGGAMPLITDDASAAAPDTHSWELVDAAASLPDEDGEIPWILRGNAENVARARAALEQALKAAQTPSVTGYLILPDPGLYRFVVGQGGSTVNGIRKRTGTRVQVPKGGKGDEAIEIVGEKKGVEEARDLILEAVRNGSR